MDEESELSVILHVGRVVRFGDLRTLTGILQELQISDDFNTRMVGEDDAEVSLGLRSPLNNSGRSQ